MPGGRAPLTISSKYGVASAGRSVSSCFYMLPSLSIAFLRCWNGIRDDVELAIFEKYPNSPYTRAAELQYAMALQMYLTEVFNSETWKIAAEQKSRGSTCLSLTYPRDDLEQFFKVVDARVGEVDDLMLNTAERRDHYDFLDKYTTSFGLNDTNVCDLDN